MIERNRVQTIHELEKWLKEHCYSMDNYSINGNAIYEGFGLENNGGVFLWFYTERGEKQPVEYFSTEKDAVQYALDKITSDEHANRNFIGMFHSKEELDSIISELIRRGLEYYTDKIPFGYQSTSTRVFVIGCGIKKAQDLIKRNS